MSAHPDATKGTTDLAKAGATPEPKKASDPPKPGGTPDPAKPGADPAKTETDPAKSGADPAKPGEGHAKPGEDHGKPGEDPAKTGSDTAKGGDKGKGGPPPPPPPRAVNKVHEDDDPHGDGPVFIYGGPWIKMRNLDVFLDETTPINIQLSGIFKKSYAYYSLKERTPAMLTKVIDVASKIQASQFVSLIAKLKNELVTNKPYGKFTATDEVGEYDKWNEWIDAQDPKTFYGNNWCWTECYVYRKIIEARDLCDMKDFDPFENEKHKAFSGNVEPMCVVAEKLLEFNQPKEDKAKKKEEWVALSKVCLWANRCDLSQSLGEEANMKDVCPLPVLPFPKPNAKPKPLKKGKLPPVAPPLTDLGYIDPFQISLDLKSNLLVDESGKAFEQLFKRAEKIRSNIQKQNEKDPSKPEPDWVAMFPPKGAKKAKPPKKPPPAEGAAPEPPPPEPPKIPCPAKMTVPQSVFLDIVCDNAGYELFSDICIAHWAISQGLADKVRFHVKKYPWFISDVTKKDFQYVVDQCKSANYSKDAVKPPPPPPPPVAPGAPPPPEVPPPAPEPPRPVRSTALNQIAGEWQKFLDEGKFQVMADDFWTYPHTFDKMKDVDPEMYRKLQYAALIIFKGDLNYRKLMGEKNVAQSIGLEPNLQGFYPAPMMAVRTVKSETVCGLPKGRFNQMNEFDPKWMEKGNFGVIQMSKKAEGFPKQPTRPCIDYGITCFGEICPVHTDI